jgi:hypothetical protein
MTRRPLAGAVLSEADARARGLVPTREAATIYGCDPNSLPKAMRRVGTVGAWVRGGDKAGYWWHPRDVLAARAVNRTRYAGRNVGRTWRPETRRKNTEHYRAKLLRRIAQREAGR